MEVVFIMHITLLHCFAPFSKFIYLFIYFHQTQTQYSKIQENNIKMMEEVQRKAKACNNVAPPENK